ncbi:MAG: ATP-binding protein [Clostridia bacterium]|nr:ATP-binding protein [Clostridia bacterium]
MISRKISDISQIDEILGEFSSHLTDCNLSDDAVFRSRLVACELLSNVFRHGGDEASFDGELRGDAVRIAVTGGSPALISDIYLPDVYEEKGRGLYIVQRFCGGNIAVTENTVSVLIKITK